MENFEEKSCLCALNRIFGFEPKAGLRLLEHFGTACKVFNASPDELDSIMGPYSKHRGFISRKAVEQAADELRSLSREGIQFCGITEDSYPLLLKECPDAPIGLYIRSDTPINDLWTNSGIAVVGTRDISPYGREWCSRIVKGLSMTGKRPDIISGLALGVDGLAHKTALEHGLATTAVMATGPETIYPYRHRDLACRIAHTPGCALITDYPPGTAPLAIHFLRRNRIIAGLSSATLLIESKIKGGGLMTCNLAFSYDRDVFALPGRVDDIRSQGCNELIRAKKAEPITGVDSLVEALGMNSRLKNRRSPDYNSIIRRTYRGASDQVATTMTLLLGTIGRNRGLTVEELAGQVGIRYAEAAELTGILEIDGLISIDLMQRCSINPNFM